MSNFEDKLQGLEREVPEMVWQRYMDTLEHLPEHQETRLKKRINWMKYAVSAATVAIVGTGLCCANPALAAKIPVIGKIFEQVQEIALFSGEYSGKAQVLTGETAAVEEMEPEQGAADGAAGSGQGVADGAAGSGQGAADGAAGSGQGTVDGAAGSGQTIVGTAVNPAYMAEDGGVRITASEIYCDGLAVFLTAEVTVDQGGLEKLPGSDQGDTLYLDGSWGLEGTGSEEKLLNNNLTGKAIDDRTFAGMLRLDLNREELATAGGTVNLRISRVGYDDTTMLDAEDISASHQMNGAWNLSLPYTVDDEAAKTIPVEKESGGYCLRQVFVSPYQVITYTDVPQTELTQEELEAAVAEKLEENPDIADDQELFELLGVDFQASYTIVFDQNGEKLTPVEEVRGRAVYAVQGKELTSLNVYVFDNFEDWVEMDEKGVECEAAGRALIAETVAVE